MFQDAATDRRNGGTPPFFSDRFVCCVILPFRFLIRQSGFGKSAANRFLRNVVAMFFENDLMQSTSVPKIGFEAEIDGGFQDDVFQQIVGNIGQLSRSPTDGHSPQSVDAIAFEALHPSIQGRAVDAVVFGDFALWQPVLDGFDRMPSKIESRINRSLFHVLFYASRSLTANAMLQNFCGELYDERSDTCDHE